MMAPGKKIQTPSQWLASLGEAIRSALSRADGAAIDLDSGSMAAHALFKEVKQAEKSVFWVGNGGSSAICSHLSQDVMNKLEIRSFYLGDAALLTCMANDFGYEQVYARPLDQMAGEGDLLIAISSSGNSENILSCMTVAKKKKMKTLTLSGMDPSNRLWNTKADLSFFVSSDLYGIVETSHEAILHGIIETLWLRFQAGEI